jgi:PAS domain S-box-containing protein
LSGDARDEILVAMMSGSASDRSTRNDSDPATSRIIGEGEMADRVRAYDWSSTPLGPVGGWSKELITIVNLTLCSPSPARTMWGAEFILIYNDAYRSFPGPRHPAALGKPAKDVYGESWPVVGPLLESAFTTGKTLFHEKLRVPLPARDGTRDSYLNYSFHPIYENGTIAGLFGHLHDVTGEVLATRRLEESEARSSRILRSIGDAVIVMDAETRITHMNPIAETLTGWSEREATGLPLSAVFRIVNEGTRQTAENPAEKVRALGTGVGLANHTILIARDGQEAAIDDSGAPILDDEGKLIGIVLVFRNIEDKRAAERERERIAEQLTQVMEATTDAIVGVSRSWRLTYLNPRAKQLYASDREILGLTLWEAFPEAADQGSPYAVHFNRAMREGIASVFEGEYPAPLNLRLRIEVFPARDGIVIFSRDISQEEADREALRHKSEETERQRAEIETLYRTAPIGLALFDTKDFRYLRLNDRQAEFFGLKPEQIVGRTLTEMAPIEGLRELFEQVRDGKPVINYPLEGTLVTNPAEHRYWTVSYFPVIGPDGTIQAITAASLEVTQQKKIEKALVQSEKLAVAGRMAASIAHEINNPLESVTNLVYLANNSDDLAESKRYTEMAARELRRVAAITSQTLRFHKQLTSPQEVRAKNLIDNVLSLYEGRIANSAVQVEERRRALTTVRCFEGEIRQVLSNLVSNALDAMHGSGGRLLLRSRDATDRKTGGKGVVITVADTGVGIPRSSVARIFDAFYTTKDLGGTGLGLWVSREIVARHGGMLRVRSAQGDRRHGTVFALFLPVAAVARSMAGE